MKDEILFPEAETAKNSFMNRVFHPGCTGCPKKHDSWESTYIADNFECRTKADHILKIPGLSDCFRNYFKGQRQSRRHVS